MAILAAGLLAIGYDGLGAHAGDLVWLGDLGFVAAGALWGTFTFLLRRWRVDALQATATVAVLSMAVVVPAYLVLYGLPELPAGAMAVQAVYQGGLGGCLGVLAYSLAVSHLGASRAALFPSFVPALATLLAMPMLGQVPDALQATGILLASLGLLDRARPVRPQAGSVGRALGPLRLAAPARTIRARPGTAGRAAPWPGSVGSPASSNASWTFGTGNKDGMLGMPSSARVMRSCIAARTPPKRAGRVADDRRRPEEILLEEMVEQVLQGRRDAVIVLAADDHEPVDRAIERRPAAPWAPGAAPFGYSLYIRSSSGRRYSSGSTSVVAWPRRRSWASMKRAALMPCRVSRTEP